MIDQVIKDLLSTVFALFFPMTITKLGPHDCDLETSDGSQNLTHAMSNSILYINASDQYHGEKSYVVDGYPVVEASMF